MAKKLKLWNGRGHGKYDKGHIYVAAYSIKQACELVGAACELSRSVSYSEIKEYYSNCWGNPMEGIEPNEPCLYATKSYYDNSPVKII